MKWIVAILILFSCVVGCADEIDDIVPYIIQVESGGNPNAVSKAGAVGLMQITPIVQEEFIEYQSKYNAEALHEAVLYVPTLAPHSTAELFIPAKNVWLGTWYLRRLRDHYLKNVSGSVAPTKLEVFIFTGGLMPSLFFDNRYKLETKQDVKLALVLTAWNGGITRLKENKYDMDEMPKETKQFVKKVMQLYKEGNHER